MKRLATALAILLGSAILAGPALAVDYTEFIWETAPFPSAHASTIVEAPDHALLAAWFGGTDEGNKDVGIWLSRKAPGAAWNPPVLIYKEPNIPAWNPVLFRDREGQLTLFFKIGPSPERWTGAYVVSKDGGKNWGPVVWMTGGLLGPIKNKPIQLQNGDIVSGTSVESYKAWGSWMEISSDGGKSWTKHGPIMFPDADMDRRGTIQPTIMEIKPGVVRGFFRTRGMGKVATATSNDGGRNWGPVTLTALDHPGAGVDAVKLADGRCVIIYNPSTKKRNPLTLAVSKDLGETWKDTVEIDRLPDGDPSELSYPSVVQGEDGTIHISYTFRRERIKHAAVPLTALGE